MAGYACKKGDYVTGPGGVKGVVTAMNGNTVTIDVMTQRGGKWQRTGSAREIDASQVSMWDTKGMMMELDAVDVVEELSSAPELPIPSDINLDQLKEALGMDKLTWVRLPIGKIGITSRNGRTYSQQFYKSLVEQVKAERPGGRWGHDSQDKAPDLRWYDAAIDEKSGVVWGLALAVREEAARHLAAAAAGNAKAGTSIYAVDPTIDENGVYQDARLVGIDLANLHGMVGVPSAAAVPVVTREFIDNETGDTPMPENTASDVRIHELTEEQGKLKQQVTTLEEIIRQQKPVMEDFKALCEVLELPEGADAVKHGRSLVETLAEMRKEASDLLAEAIDAKITAQVKVEKVRPVVRELVLAQKPVTRKQLDRAIDDVLARESIKSLLAAGLQESMGPNQGTPANNPTQVKKGAKDFFIMPEGAGK